MDFLTLAKERYSCRTLSEMPVEREKIEKIIEEGLLAPTAKNAQPYKIWLIESEEAIGKLAEVTPFTFGAKTFFVVGANREVGFVRKYDGTNFADIDASIVATQMMLEIADLGLGTTWVGHFDAPKMVEFFPEMKGYSLVAIFPVGYPSEDAKPNERHFIRKGKDEMVRRL